MTLLSVFIWKMHFSSTNMSYPVNSTSVTKILGQLCSGLSKNWYGFSLSKKEMYKIAAQLVISERKSKFFMFLIHMEIFHKNSLVLLKRHNIKKLKATHDVKGVQIGSYFWSVCSCIWTEYRPETTIYLDTFRVVLFSILLRQFLAEKFSYYQKLPLHFDLQNVRKTWEHASKC